MPQSDLLFEPVKIGPVTAPNRFYQVPHGCGFGYREPSSMVEIRRIKAEGGWGVVCTEQTEIHPSSDMTPFAELRNWDDRDLPTLAAVAEAVQGEGSLAAIQLSHSGANTSNLGSRFTAVAASTYPVVGTLPAIPEPYQARGMNRAEIDTFRQWHRSAARRGVQAGFDIVYVYAGQFLALPNQFLSKSFNRRRDDYGGSLVNRIRLLRELIEDTLEVAGGSRAVAVRLTVDELLRPDGSSHPELEEAFDHLGSLPDLWDIIISGWGSDMAGTTRFDFDPSQIEILRYVRGLTTKPIVTVRFFPTPAEMVRLVKDGLVDFIGAARQSIADPFLPRKIREGRADDIRTCIKCNICVAGDLSASGVRCTQNPTFGEEWRRGWHPERIKDKGSDSAVLIVGAGPAGLECARALGERGYPVMLCDKAGSPGGRLLKESKLPLLEPWRDVCGYRLNAISKLANVTLRMQSALDCDAILASGCRHMVLATGAEWRRDGLDRRGGEPGAAFDHKTTFTPDDVLTGHKPSGKVVVYDDDHYYMGGLIAELLAAAGCEVTLVTPAAEVSVWTHLTMEQSYIQARLIKLGVGIVPHRNLNSYREGRVSSECVFTGLVTEIECDALVLVTMRRSLDALLTEMLDRKSEWASNGMDSVHAIGDAFVPGLIADAVRSGHAYARGLDEGAEELAYFGRDVVHPTGGPRLASGPS